MFMVEYRQTMKNARPKFVESNVVVRTVAQMRAEKRIEAERLRRERSKAWAEKLERQRLEELEKWKAENSVPNYVAPEPEKKMPVKEIVANIAAVHNLPVDALLGPRRDKIAVAARFAAIWAIRDEYPGMPTTHIGRIFKRDHTSIIHAFRVRKSRCETAITL